MQSVLQMRSVLQSILPDREPPPQPDVRRYNKNFFWKRPQQESEFSRCIPQLSDSDIIRLLKQKRSKIFLKMLASTANQNGGLRTTLPSNLFSWPHREEIMANVLLGPYLYDVSRSGENVYLTKEDKYLMPKVEPFICPMPYSKNFAADVEELGDYGISYSSWQIVVNGSIGKQTFALGPSEDKKFIIGKYNIYQYKYPEERDIVSYLRLMREMYEPRSPDDPSKLEWILYHNILSRYVYPDAYIDIVSRQKTPAQSRVESRQQTLTVSRVPRTSERYHLTSGGRYIRIKPQNPRVIIAG